MDIVGISYLGFESATIAQWRDYGPDVLAFSTAASPEDDAESLYFKLDDRRHRLAFHPGPIDRLAYIGWEARGRMEFLAAIAKFEAEGIAVERGDAALAARRGVRELIRFKDPVGFQHELFYGQKYTPGSFLPPRPHAGFNTAERGICHLVVITPEYTDELEHFLTQVMGFSWYGSGAGKGRTGFFRAKLNDKTSHDIAYGHGPGMRGIQHIGLYVNTVNDVGKTYDIVKERQIPMMFTLGQHTQDPHLSFYHYSPSGFAVETIYEVEPWHPEMFELNPEKLSSWGHQLVGPVLGPSVKKLAELGEVG
ncbi:VOC family protein [Sphingomonas sp. A2-49]|uniref:VOC family protein n=1 Tax=Sphingomonas sp. A2-49 TaxID=1391375 RepID=UPI0021CFF41A|nr:VOC family protein [Sphingomonas sp. A2-49]MCU6453109.1 VOC family protein [Sphingomonas sp. A2-49]